MEDWVFQPNMFFFKVHYEHSFKMIMVETCYSQVNQSPFFKSILVFIHLESRTEDWGGEFSGSWFTL